MRDDGQQQGWEMWEQEQQQWQDWDVVAGGHEYQEDGKAPREDMADCVLM